MYIMHMHLCLKCILELFSLSKDCPNNKLLDYLQFLCFNFALIGIGWLDLPSTVLYYPNYILTNYKGLL